MRFLFFVVFITALVAPTTGFSQPFEPREDEAEFSAAALEHAKAGNFEAAIEEAEKAVAVRGLNVFWLNLGRFQQRDNRCADAMTSFTNAMTAPPVTKPEQKLVRQTAQKYVAELADECPAQVTVKCTPADMQVSVRPQDGGSTATPVACGQPTSLGGGTWVFTGTYGTETTEATEVLRIAREYEVSLVIGVPVAESPKTVNEPPTNNATGDTALSTTVEPAKRSSVVPIALFSSAGAVALTGLTLDTVLATSHNGQLDGIDFLPLGLYLTSIGLVVAGFLW